jgi:predicted mannosyl-3-phosphoglycerate phosphatase (HAD superfamily)
MSTTASSMIVVTGVDGILRCAQTGSCRDTLEALRWLATYDVPVVMASHGSAADVVRFQAEVGLRHPFIADGGASIFIPRQYFGHMPTLGVQLPDWERVDVAAEPGDVRPALEFVLSLYRVARGDDLLVVGCAADLRDQPVLELADVRVLVRGGSGLEPLLRSWPAAYVTTEVGPAGWSEAILGGVAA